MKKITYLCDRIGTNKRKDIPGKDDNRKGAQIDLVIHRADKIIHLVEMKFCERQYTITKDYEERLKTRKNLFMDVMGISRGGHSSFIHSQLTAKDLFTPLNNL